MPFTVVYDANALYPAPLRDLLLELAAAGEFRAHYTEEILDEVFRNLQANRRDLDANALARTRDLMRRVPPDVMVAGHMDLVPALTLPDPDDRHVLAAAIRCGAQVIVTHNRKDFPPDALAAYDIEAQHPDVFVNNLADLHPAIVIHALTRISQRLKNPPRTPRQIVDTLEDNGLVQTAATLRPLLQ